MPTYASKSDVVNRLGRPLTDEEQTLTDTRLADAERMLERRVDLAAGIDAGDFTEADVVQIEADAVIRILRNPDGYTSETDGTYSYRMNWDVASGKLEIRDSEWRVLGVSTGISMIDVRPRGLYERYPRVPFSAGG